MVRNMVCHAAWQLLILSALIFGVGDVCEGHGDVCTGPARLPPLLLSRDGMPPLTAAGACPFHGCRVSCKSDFANRVLQSRD
jgi:hypothetical protein